MPYWFTSSQPEAYGYRSSTERPILGCIGTGSRWGAVGPQAMRYADCVAVCDVDANHAGRGKARVVAAQKAKEDSIEVHEDYRKILDRKDVDVVTIVTPDHWHSKIAIEALQAGKHVYCEKPLTLTIQEGKQIIDVLNKAKKTFQVGTQQRSEMGQRFLKAIALARSGRIGDIRNMVCNIGGSTDSGEIPVAEVPKGLNWEMWLGQCPVVDYRFKSGGGRWGRSRCHYEFRWWYEYSGGKMTDWGAHHVDIAQWAIEQNGPDQGVVKVEPVMHKHPVPYENGNPTMDDRYNAATNFDVKCTFANGVEMHIVSHSKEGNGILFEGTKGSFHVSRGNMKGKPVDELKDNPLPEDAVAEIYGGMPTSHMQNFFDCIKSGEKPISDVWTHHRAMTTCHLANIAIRLDKTLEWDPKEEMITNESPLNVWQSREQRKGYEINV